MGRRVAIARRKLTVQTCRNTGSENQLDRRQSIRTRSRVGSCCAPRRRRCCRTCGFFRAAGNRPTQFGRGKIEFQAQLPDLVPGLCSCRKQMSLSLQRVCLTLWTTMSATGTTVRTTNSADDEIPSVELILSR